MKASEPEVREMLRRRASEFSMASKPSPRVLRRAHRRLTTTIVLTGVMAVVIGTVGVLSLNVLRVPPPPAHSAGDAPTPPSASSAPWKLVRYAFADPGRQEDHVGAGGGHGVTVGELRDHAECMRSEGFDVPDPTHGPYGWGIIIDDPQAQGLDVGSPQFREAMFVTCGPLGGPFSGDMVIGGSRDKIDRLMSCMSRQGFDLPEPTLDTTGRYDVEEWEFDLTGTGIDTSLPNWHRALFVTCHQD
jgi:hypothetical protein